MAGDRNGAVASVPAASAAADAAAAAKVAQLGKVWAVKIGKKEFKLYDLPIAELDEIADHHNTSWIQVVEGPALTLALGAEVIATAAKKLGVDVPELTARSILKILVKVPDDLPEEYVDGIPLAEGSETTTSSSSTT